MDGGEEAIMDFRPILGHENYEITSSGIIRRVMTQNLVKTQISDSGYRVVTLWTSGVKKTRRVSKLIWESFNDCKCEETIDHINQNKIDDKLENLRCISNQENSKNKNIYKGNKYSLTEDIKREIMQKIKQGTTAYRIFKDYGLPSKYLYSVLKRGSWDKYIDESRGIQ